MEQLIFATGNEGKMREIRSILADTYSKILSMKEAGIEAEIAENGKTFEENALIKARAVAAAAPGQLVLADDSGLEVDYLNGEPGVYSARYLGEDTAYSIKNADIVRRLEVCLRKAGQPDSCAPSQPYCRTAENWWSERSSKAG